MSRPRPRPLRRQRIGSRTPKKTVLVFCEGEKTEPQYLEGLKRDGAIRERSSVELRIDRGYGGRMPRTLVDEAAAVRKRTYEDDGEVDEVWCVFDVEWPLPHPHLAETVARAREAGVQVAISNPCFELWLILHFQDQASPLTTAQAVRLRRRLDKVSGKAVDVARYLQHLDDAVRRAAQLDAEHARVGTLFPHDNPSSGMHRLITSMMRPAAH